MTVKLTGLAGTIQVLFDLVSLKADTDGSIPLNDFKLDPKTDITFGSDSGQANEFVHGSRSISSSATEDLNISGGAHASAIALKNDYGDTVSATKIVALLIYNTGATALEFGGDGTDNITSMFKANANALEIPAGSYALFVNPAGYAVATDEVITIVNLTAAVGSYKYACACIVA